MLHSALLPVALATRTQADGLWLIGIGALLLATVGIATRRFRLHLQFGGLGDTRGDRVAFAGTSLGLVATAAGRILIAIRSTPTFSFILATLPRARMIGWLLPCIALEIPAFPELRGFVTSSEPQRSHWPGELVVGASSRSDD